LPPNSTLLNLSITPPLTLSVSLITSYSCSPSWRDQSNSKILVIPNKSPRTLIGRLAKARRNPYKGSSKRYPRPYEMRDFDAMELPLQLQKQLRKWLLRLIFEARLQKHRATIVKRKTDHLKIALFWSATTTSPRLAARIVSGCYSPQEAVRKGSYAPMPYVRATQADLSSNIATNTFLVRPSPSISCCEIPPTLSPLNLQP